MSFMAWRIGFVLVCAGIMDLPAIRFEWRFCSCRHHYRQHARRGDYFRLLPSFRDLT
jgi:hypothetical protein